MNNVIILGAGASVGAGIPVLKNFVQTIWEIAIRGRYKDIELSEDDKKIYRNAIKVRDDLDYYHGRANFDDKNIEDILSILSFNMFEKKANDTYRMNQILSAIERTIEITCEVKHDGRYNHIQNNKIDIYNLFWHSLFDLQTRYNTFPSIITFNYDLVFERSLMQNFATKEYNQYERFPVKGINIKYYYEYLDRISFEIKNGNYGMNEPGLYAELSEFNEDYLDINLLKLHGSVNFPNKKNDKKLFMSNVEKPLILPPVFNKMNDRKVGNIWKEAIIRLRNATNIVFVGYSLPETDVYMQYFLKSAIGPNKDLNKIIVFDPQANDGSQTSEIFKSRYKNCFSNQIHERILFNPDYGNLQYENGTFNQFVMDLNHSPEEILFL